MASLFRPVGPLPPGVYWRRRALILGIPLLLVGLIAWACSAGGSPGGPTAAPPPTPSRTPAATITAPPMPSDLPGGGPGPTYGGGTGGTTGPGGGTGGTTGPGSGGNVSLAPGAATGVPGPGGVDGQNAVRSCTAADVTVSVVPTHPTFSQTDLPKFQVSALNHSTTACAVWWPDVVVTSASGARVYGSQDCVTTRGRWVLPAGSEQFQTVPWNLQRSAPGCAATALGQLASPAGTYRETVSVFPGGPAVGGAAFTVR